MVIASTAVALILLSLKTYQTIRYLGVGKSFWMPVALSGFLFFFGSVTAILFELNFSLTEYTKEVVQVSQFAALCTLVGGVYSYSKRITRDLGEKFILTDKPASMDHEADIETRVIPPITESIERSTRKSLRVESEVGCRHQFGYLRTQPPKSTIPDECLSCDKIIRCKHSSEKS